MILRRSNAFRTLVDVLLCLCTILL